MYRLPVISLVSRMDVDLTFSCVQKLILALFPLSWDLVTAQKRTWGWNPSWQGNTVCHTDRRSVAIPFFACDMP